MAKINNPHYRYYVVITPRDKNSDSKIESGWEYKQDAAHHIRMQLPYVFSHGAKVLQEKGLRALGLVAGNDSDWYTEGS